MLYPYLNMKQQGYSLCSVLFAGWYGNTEMRCALLIALLNQLISYTTDQIYCFLLDMYSKKEGQRSCCRLDAYCRGCHMWFPPGMEIVIYQPTLGVDTSDMNTCYYVYFVLRLILSSLLCGLKLASLVYFWSLANSRIWILCWLLDCYVHALLRYRLPKSFSPG